MAVNDFTEERLACDRDQDANADANEGEAADSGGPSALGLEGDRVCDEAEV